MTFIVNDRRLDGLLFINDFINDLIMNDSPPREICHYLATQKLINDL